VASVVVKRKIWMLWLQGYEAAPSLVKQCIESWRVQNPTWSLTILGQQDVDNLWTSPREKRVAGKMPSSALANLVRMKLLSTQGGVWVDATLACKVPLDNWIQLFFNTGFFAFHRPNIDRPLANWFLAANPQHYIIKSWLEVTLRVWDQETVVSREPVELCGKLLAGMAKNGKVWLKPDFWKNIETLPYFWHHYLFDGLIQTDKTFKKYWSHMPKCSANLPHMIQSGKFLTNDDVTMSSFQSMLDSNMAPLYKLDWREMDPSDSAKLQYLLDACRKV